MLSKVSSRKSEPSSTLLIRKLPRLPGSEDLQLADAVTPLTPEFFMAETVSVARDLLGMAITTVVRGKRTAGMIVEVEAYLGKDDDACHASKRRTPRNEVMFWAGGHCYVYFIYGNHFCVNVVTENEGIGCAVLIRAIEPLAGLGTMKRRRGPLKRDYDLTNGPGKACQALGIDKRMLGENLITSGLINIRPYKKIRKSEIIASKRIGIVKSKELDLRFYIKNSPWVSGARIAATR